MKAAVYIAGLLLYVQTYYQSLLPLKSCSIFVYQGMRASVLAASATAAVAQATPLNRVCTGSHIRNSFPENGTYLFYPSTITANAVHIISGSEQTFFSGGISQPRR
jgi:hypothetical protein